MTRPYTLLSLGLALLLISASQGVAAPQKQAPPPKPLKKAALKSLIKEATACPVLHGSRCEALKTIIGHREAAAPALLSYLKSKTALHRAIAATALGAIGYGPAGRKVLPLVDDKDPVVQQAAIVATGRLAPDGSVRALARSAGKEDLNIRVLSTTALGLTRKAAAVTPLMRLLVDPHPKVQANAARSLGAIGNSRATLALAAMLADPVTRTPVRLAITESLGRLGDAEAVAILLQATAETEPQIRKAAVVSLGQLKDERAVRALSLLARDVEVREAAIRAIGQIGHVDGLPSLLRIAKEPGADPITVKQAFWALGEIKSEATVAALKPYLVAKDTQMVRLACDALGRVRLPSATQALIDTLHHDDREIREMAAWALQQLTGVNLGTEIARWEQWFYARKNDK
uniref:HEAT repeat protein n=1 Tax=uncultured bacterium HF186_75m_14K15 TaxID=662886 RepID=C7FPC2_9BACT|nr:HEAT repeat protein [uncultured bacterium HF186_75m_14K15]